MKLKVTLLITFCFLSFALQGQINGPTSVSPGVNVNYVFQDDLVYPLYNWTVTNGTIVTKGRSGQDYTVTAKFNCTTPQTLTFLSGSTVVASLAISVSGGVAMPSTPVTAFTYLQNCGNTVITRTGNPPTGVSWYWQTSPIGTSTALGMNNTLTVTGSGTYYLRAIHNSCSSSWSKNALATSPVTVKIIPTVAASNQSICSGQKTNIVITNPNNVSGTTFSWAASATSSNGSSAGSGTSIAQTLTNLGNTNGNVTYTITPLANGCTGVPITAVATVKPLPNAAAADQKIFSGNSTAISISNPNQVAGTTFSWTTTSTNVSGASPGSGTTIAQVLQNTVGTGTVTYLITPTSSGCSGTPLTIIANVETLPVITATNNGYVSMGTPVNLDPGGGYTTYLWKNSANLTLGSTQTLSTAIPDTYSLTVSKSGVTGNGTSSFTVKPQFADMNENYVTTTTVLIDQVTTAAAVTGLTPDQATQEVRYFDGLGRAIQTVTTQGSPLRRDMVMANEYDAYGREPKKYLPYISVETNGRIKSNPFKTGGVYSSSPQFMFYNNGLTDMVADDPNPYSESIFEPSQLNRIIKQGAAGQSWQPDQVYGYASNDHTTRYAYETNDTLEVLKWTYSYPTDHLPFGTVEAGSATTLSYFMPGELIRIRMKNENGNEHIQYIDKLGRTILKRDQSGNSGVVDDTSYAGTYYIFNGKGSLVCIIPPEGTRRLLSEYFSRADSVKEKFLSGWAFRFAFDDRKRMIRKQVPGAAPLWMVYDQRDRLVMVQDGNQRLTNQWSFTKYDNLNRQVMTGVYTHDTPLDQTEMSTLLSSTAQSETYNGNTLNHGYSNQVFPNTPSATVLNVTYYDNYNFKNLASGLNYINNDLPGQEASAFGSVLGKVTGTKVNTLETSQYTFAVNYFDQRYRLIQAIKQNHAGGYDRISSIYDFPGRIQQSKTTHNRGTANHLVLRKFRYDHASRLLEIRHTVDSRPEVLLLQNRYNELGQLIDRKLHSTDNGQTFRQSIDRRYNIRGWLASINNADLANDNGITNDDNLIQESRDLFGMELAYDQVLSGISTQPNAAFNGNISAIRWSANQGISLEKGRGYRFTYDRLSRLTGSAYYSKSAGSWAANGKFSEDGISYDLNGNILTLRRKAYDYSNTHALFTMDDLAYHYENNALLSISDSGDKLSGLTDPATDTPQDYAYDANGNLVTDLSKGIPSITYNHLNLPVQLNTATSDYLKYTYDASGKKISKQVWGADPRITEYFGEFVYLNGSLQFINHEEGRIVMTGALPEYQYYLKDHLGNIRSVITSQNVTDVNMATYESTNQTIEASRFLRADRARRINSTIFDRTNGVAAGYAERLNGTANEKYGLARSISVVPGDIISAEVFAKYVDPNVANWTSALGSLMSQISRASSSVVVDGINYNSGTSGFGFAGLLSQSSNGAPKAYLNWLVFDKDFMLIPDKSGYRQITTASREYGQDVAHERLFSPSIEISEPGSVYIYLSNEELTPVEVYFDDFKVTQVKTPIVSTSDYYPFGLAFNEYRRDDEDGNPYRFNGKERQDELGMGWLDFGRRMLNPETGRWMVPDQMAEISPNLTPYRFGFNNPVRYVDPNGLYETDGHFWTVYLVATIMNLSHAGSIAQWTEAPDNWMSQDGDSHYGTKTYLTPSWRGPVHSLTGGTPDYERWLSVTGVMQSNNETALGISLHRLGDSFAHTIPGKDKMFGPDVGHLFYGHAPDKIKNRPELYLQYVSTLFETLSVKFGKAGTSRDMFTFEFIAAAGMGTAENSAILETEIALRNGKKTFTVEGNQQDAIASYMKYRKEVTGSRVGVSVVHTTSDVYEYNATSREFIKTGTRSVSVVTFDNN